MQNFELKNDVEVIVLSAESVADPLESSTKDIDEKKENAHNTHSKSDKSPTAGDQSKKEKEAIVGGLVRVIGQMSKIYFRSCFISNLLIPIGEIEKCATGLILEFITYETTIHVL